MNMLFNLLANISTTIGIQLTCSTIETRIDDTSYMTKCDTDRSLFKRVVPGREELEPPLVVVIAAFVVVLPPGRNVVVVPPEGMGTELVVVGGPV
jgi:hypothetical protein